MRLPPLRAGSLIRRYKRFLADVRLDTGEEVCAHCPNPGRMTACMEKGGRVWLSAADSPKRKLKWTWEISELSGSPPVQVLVHTGRINALVEEALERGVLSELGAFESLRREVRCGDSRRGLDFLLRGADQRDCWVEVKSATMRAEDHLVRFPDAVTTRGKHHLEVLVDRVQLGDRAVLLFVVPRADGVAVGPADAVDPAYAETLRWAAGCGVEIYARRASVSPNEVLVTDAMPVRLDA